jgi:hypothetical protein
MSNNDDFTQTCNVINQRNQLRLFNIPPTRFNIISPYPANTQAELDMRRKAEILQYNKNSTQKGKITKAQQWANLVKGPFQRNTQTTVVRDSSGEIIDYTIYNTIASCPQDKYVPTLSSSCDVPGPIITLQYNPDIPLYNYAEGENTFGIINQETSTNFNSYSSNNILSLDGIQSTLCTIAIFNMDYKLTTFEINTPIGFYVSGQANNNNNNNTNVSVDVSGIFQIYSFDISIYNNNNLITTTNIISSIVNIPVNFYTNFPKDSSGNIIGDTTFQGVQYIGNLKMSDIVLCTQPGLLYDIKVVFNIKTSFISGDQKNNFKTGIQMNLSPNNYPSSTIRCKFTDIVPTPEPLIEFYVKSISQNII